MSDSAAVRTDPTTTDPSTARSRRLRPARLAVAALAATGLAFSSLAATSASAAELTPIATVQGTAAASPLVGQTVTTQGVITGLYDLASGSGYRGFYLQTPGSGGAADATPGASDGLFVFTANNAVGAAIGDLVTVTGSVSEFQGQTQITAGAAGTIVLDEAAVGVPDATPLPDTVVGDAREAFEGMLVDPTGEYVLGSTHQLFNFGSLWLSAGGEVVQATETTDAGPAAAAIAAANKAKRLLVDDGYSIQVSNAAHPGDQPYFTADAVVRLGDAFVAPQEAMILGYGFDDWRLQPSVPLTDASPAAYKPTFQPANARPTSVPSVGGDVRAAAFNVFNYFTDFGGDARGAETPELFAVQKSKIVSAINGLDADVVALMEIENSAKFGHDVDASLADLVDGLNAAAGAGTWDYVRTPAALADPATTDFIKNAIIFKPAAVSPVGDSFADVDESVWDIAREPLAQTFDVGSGRLVTIVANHFKSKSAPTGQTGNPADGQGWFNAERTGQAQAVADFVAGIAADPAKSDDVLLLGDFNAYAQEDPIQLLTAAGFSDLLPTKAPGQYTYSFDGQLGSLDHALASPSLAASVTGVGVWGINSAEWGDRGYEFAAAEPGTPFRSSDHDPIVVGISTAAAPVQVDVLSINDFHGRLEASSTTAGAAVLGGMVDSYEAQNPNTLFVGAGDLIGASTFTSFIQQDQPTIDALNAIGLDASSFGNHEFDKGRADVDDRILEEADWPYLAANLYEKGTETPAFQEYEVREFGTGDATVSVGFIGAVTEDLPTLVSPAGIATLDVGEVVPAVNRVADQLSDGDAANGEADVLFLLVHEGAATVDIASATDDSAFGRIVTGVNANVDAIVSGHTHLAYNHQVAIPGTDRTRPVLSSGQYGEKYGLSKLSIDPTTGELVNIQSEVLNLVGAFPADPEVALIVADAVAKAKELGSVSLGSITEDLNRAKQSAAAFSENRGGESTIGNLIADVQLSATEDLGTQVAVMNPGGIRADLKFASGGAGDADGNVTYQEAATVQPFANTLVTTTLTGAQLKSILEEQWQPGAARPFLKLGLNAGFEYSYDPAAAQGSHVTWMTLDGEPVTPEQTIKVVTNSFLASGGDGFVTFAEGVGTADSGRIDLDAFVDYLGENSPIEPDYAQRAVGATLSAPADAAGYVPGESVTATLSSLLFSNGGATTGEATVSLGDTELGSAPLAFAIVDSLDEQGTATVTFTVPEGTEPGTQALTIGGPGGTAVDVPITVAEVAPPAEPVATSVSGSASKLLSFGGSGITYRATVTAADGSAPAGEVAIYDLGRKIATAPLATDASGKVTVALPKLSRGIHLLTAGFSGEGFESSRGWWPSIVIVL